MSDLREIFRWSHPDDKALMLRVAQFESVFIVQWSPNGDDWYDATEGEDYHGEEEVVYLAWMLSDEKEPTP